MLGAIDPIHFLYRLSNKGSWESLESVPGDSGYKAEDTLEKVARFVVGTFFCKKKKVTKGF